MASNVFAQSVPMDVQMACAAMNTSPYSALQNLKIVRKDGSIQTFFIEIADNDSERNQGMMCRTTIKSDFGMLFVFGNAAERSFWMKNTLVPLDILYIDQSGKIISIQKNAKPLNLQPLRSKGASVAVLEIKGGLADKLKIKPGDTLSHVFFRNKTR
jgi:uncharacterized membrane protein (UPF0127 family)